MRAVVLERFGIDGLELVERPEPECGPGQVLVGVRACSLNYRDLLLVEGRYNPRQPLPLVPLSDGAGEVLAVGAGVERVGVGDRVAGIFAQRWLAGAFTPQARASTLGGPLDGMLAERVVLDAEGVVAVPEHLDFTEAACLPCAGVTAYSALFVHGGLRAGQTVLLLGTGGVSLFALQLAVAAGARCIVTSSSPAKLERARALGADAGIDYRAEPEWQRRVLELTGGAGADVVVEVGGGQTLPRSVAATRFDGRVALIGVLSGVRTELPLTAVLMKQVRIQGVLVGSREAFEGLCRLVGLHRLRPLIDRRFGLDRVDEAFAQLRSGAHFGKVVVELG